MNLDALLAANPNPVIVEVSRVVAVAPQLFQFSPSQVDTFRDCKRKWAFDKIDRVPRTSNEAAQLGTAVHKLRELWLRDGVLPAGDEYAAVLARAGIEQLPMPRVANIEGRIEMKALLNGKPAYWIGFVDFSIADQGLAGYYPPERSDWPSVDGVPLVGDHKTAGRVDYIKSPEFLVNEDAQGSMYPMWALNHFKVDAVDLFWHYIVKNKKPKAVPVRVRATRTQTEAAYGKVLDDAGLMMSIFDTPGIKAQDVEPNPKSCDKYGGCAHRISGRCTLTTDQKLGALRMSTGDLEQLMKNTLNFDTSSLPGAGTPTPPAAVAAVVPVVTAELVAPASALADLQAAMSGGVVIDMPPSITSPDEPASVDTFSSIMGGTAAAVGIATVAEAAKALSEADKLVVTQPPAVLPPDAPPADLDAEPSKDKPKKVAATMKKRREAIATQLFGHLMPVALETSDSSVDGMLDVVLLLTDKFIAKLDE